MTEPKLSAACIILSAEPKARVLLIKRSEKLRFMAGHHAFPGGRIAADEPEGRVVGADDPVHARAIHALAREIFEETGLLLVEGARPDAAELRRARLEILEDERKFDPFLESHGLVIRAADFIPAGYWITPKGSPIRFRAEYFIHQCREAAEPEVVEGEIVAAEWIDPAEARLRWREGAMLLPPPVAYCLQQLAVFPLERAIEPIRRTTHIVPDTPGRIEWRCGINVIPLRAPSIPPATHTNCVAVGEREICVIDPGSPYSEEQAILKGQLDQLLELGGRIVSIVLTHGHPDHVGAVEFLREAYGAPVWAHEVTAGRVPFKIDRHLAHDEVFTLAGEPDWRLRCLHTPGHDPGHLCFMEETTRTMIAGDMIAERGSIVISARHGGDVTHYLSSLELLTRDDYDLMIPAHGLAFTNPQEKAREYIAHRLGREEKIRRAVESGAKTMPEILASAYADVPQAVWPLAEQSVEAHLVRLGVKLEG